MIGDSDGLIGRYAATNRPITYVVSACARILLHPGSLGPFEWIFRCWSMARYCLRLGRQQCSPRVWFFLCRARTFVGSGRGNQGEKEREAERRRERERKREKRVGECLFCSTVGTHSRNQREDSQRLLGKQSCMHACDGEARLLTGTIGVSSTALVPSTGTSRMAFKCLPKLSCIAVPLRRADMIDVGDWVLERSTL